MPLSTPPARSRAHLLESIGSPADLRKLEPGELPALADELRNFLIDSLSRTGGEARPCPFVPGLPPGGLPPGWRCQPATFVTPP